MKIVKLDDELYQYIASQTTAIGEESPSDILRRLLNFPQCTMDPNADHIGENISIFDAIDETIAPAQPKLKKQPVNSVQQLTQKVEALLKTDTFLQETKGVNRFLRVLSVLYRTNPESFANAVEPLQGHTRVYFARDEATLLSYGTHTKPKQIPESPFWVITNTNSQRKMLMLERAMLEMQLPPALVEKVRHFF